MNEQKQNIAIAENMGWKFIGASTLGHLSGRRPEGEAEWRIIPNYTTNLNAMHEVIKKSEFLFSKRNSYREHIRSAVTRDLGLEMIKVAFCECIEASSAQRAEAYLRTIGKWEGE